MASVNTQGKGVNISKHLVYDTSQWFCYKFIQNLNIRCQEQMSQQAVLTCAVDISLYAVNVLL